MSAPQIFTLSRWYKNDGEVVRKGDPIYELETDKASAEVEADKNGILRHLAKVGDLIRVGDKVARIDPIAEDRQ